MERKKVIIDMDIGDDIDDALALYFAMRLGYDIIGITTCFGDTEKRARIAKKLLGLYGNGYENVPVYAGVKSDICIGTYLCQYTSELDADTYASDGDNAVDFIIESCKKYGRDLAVLAIGPFTNIAAVIEKEKDIFNTIGRFIIMGGAYFRQYADWNVMCDVPAAAKMFDNVDIIEALGADVTHKLSIGKENSGKLLATSADKAAEYVASLYAAWLTRSRRESAFLHDPLVVCCLEEPEVCTFTDASVAVITDGYAKGLTLNVDAYGKAHMNGAYADFDRTRKIKVAKDVDRDAVVEKFMSIF